MKRYCLIKKEIDNFMSKGLKKWLMNMITKRKILSKLKNKKNSKINKQWKKYLKNENIFQKKNKE